MKHGPQLLSISSASRDGPDVLETISTKLITLKLRVYIMKTIRIRAFVVLFLCLLVCFPFSLFCLCFSVAGLVTNISSLLIRNVSSVIRLNVSKALKPHPNRRPIFLPPYIVPTCPRPTIPRNALIDFPRKMPKNFNYNQRVLLKCMYGYVKTSLGILTCRGPSWIGGISCRRKFLSPLYYFNWFICNIFLPLKR